MKAPAVQVPVGYTRQVDDITGIIMLTPTSIVDRVKISIQIRPKLTRPSGHSPVSAEDSKYKRAMFLATVVEHPSLIDFPLELAKQLCISKATVYRLIEEYRQKYLSRVLDHARTEG